MSTTKPWKNARCNVCDYCDGIDGNNRRFFRDNKDALGGWLCSHCHTGIQKTVNYDSSLNEDPMWIRGIWEDLEIEELLKIDLDNL